MPTHTPRPGYRDYLGHVSAMVKEMNQRELALGSRSRSGDQFDIWEAVFSPSDADGYRNGYSTSIQEQ